MRRFAILAAVLVVLAMPARGAELTGQLLIATPDVGDPNFEHTVVLVVKHDQNGAFGLVVNDEVADRSFAELMGELGLDAKGAKGRVRIFAGGPVEPEKGFVLHSTEYARPETIAIGGGLALTSSAAILRDMALGKGPRRALVAFGYAGWAPGQLESEIASHGWFTAPADPKLLFDEPAQMRWQDAVKRRLQDL